MFSGTNQQVTADFKAYKEKTRDKAEREIYWWKALVLT